MQHDGDGDTNCYWYALNTIMPTKKKLGKEAEKLRNQKTSGDHADYNLIKIGQNTEKSPGNLRRLAVTQTPEK